VGIQRNVPKKTLLGQSEVHGFGLYAGQDIAQEDIIGEYTGEIVSLGEVYRRDVIYDYESTEYVFRLNKSKLSPAMFS
jgi:SET domain-containing protein